MPIESIQRRLSGQVIQNDIYGEDYKKPSRESVLERMKKAGLSTMI